MSTPRGPDSYLRVSRNLIVLWVIVEMLFWRFPNFLGGYDSTMLVLRVIAIAIAVVPLLGARSLLSRPDFDQKKRVAYSIAFQIAFIIAVTFLVNLVFVDLAREFQ